jgi:hypothetical protein
MSTEELKFEITDMKRGSATVIVSLDDKVLECRTITLTKPKERESLAEAICDKQNELDQEQVLEQLVQLAVELVRPGAAKVHGEGERGDPVELLADMPQTARDEASSMLGDPDLFQRVLEDIESLGVAGERELTATIYLVGTSRLLGSPLAAIVQGPSASGKSYLIEQTARLFPPEAVLIATQMTPQALFYMSPGSLAHRFVVAGERSFGDVEDVAEATRALREMLSGGKLSKLIAMKEEGGMVTKLIEQEGPISYVESTTQSKIFAEDANRSLMLNTDERAAQTRKIIEQVASGYRGVRSRGDIGRVIERHHALQRMLEPSEVVIPFADQVGGLLSTERVEVRRAFGQLMSMITASALLHQFQRTRDDQGRVLATEDDYQLARRLMTKPMSRLLGGGISEPAIRFHERLATCGALNVTFSTTEASKALKVQQRSVTSYLSELCDFGAVDQIEPSRGNKPAKWQLESMTIGPGCPELPAVSDVFSGDTYRHSDSTQSGKETTVMSAGVNLPETLSQGNGNCRKATGNFADADKNQDTVTL